MTRPCFVRISLLFLSALSSAQFVRADESLVTLDDAIRRALAKSFTLRIEEMNTPISQARVTAAWGKFDPTLQVSYTYSEDASPQSTDPYGTTRPPNSLAVADVYDVGVNGLMPWGLRYNIGGNGTVTRGTYNNYTHQYYSFAGVTFEQPLLRDFGFGANLADIRIAKNDKRRSEWQYKQAITDTITEVVFAFNELHFAKQRLRVALRSRALAAGLVEENQKHFKVGDRSEYDVISARARVAQREEAILIGERAVANQTNELRQLLSNQTDMSLIALPLDIADPGEPAMTPVDAAADFRRALIDRPDYQEARLLVERGRLNRAYVGNQRLPELNIVGSFGYNGFGTSWPQSRSDLEDRERRSYTAGVVLRVPLTFTQQRGRYREAKLLEQQAALREQQLEQTVLVDVVNAAGQIETTRKRMVAAARARELMQQTLDSEIKKLRAGTSSTFVVLEIQEQLAQAEIADYRAKTDANRALAEYDRQLGNTLRRWHVHLSEPERARP
ncbi:MAG TPA: TolC family protein [Opitutaceae bacterium]|nr:TolC family protein [Opitutaceae bacterium]